MNRRLPLLVLVCALVALPTLLPAQGLGVTAAIFRQFLVDYWAWRLGDEPELATAVGVPTHDHRWRDWSAPARDKAREARREFLQRLVYIATGTLSSQERLSADLLMDDLRAELDAEPWLVLTRRLSPAHGAHHQVFHTVEQMPARTVDDYERILARLRGLPAYIDQHIALFEAQLGKGLAQPASAVDAVIAQLVAQRETPTDVSPLLASFRQFPSGIDPAEQDRLRQAARETYERQFVPSWRRFETFLREVYRPAVRSDLALSALPGGAEGYGVLLRAYTGTRLSPADIHQLGQDEVARITRQMARVAREGGFAGSADEYEQALARRPAAQLEDADAMRAHAQAVLARVESESSRLLRRLPRVAVEVRVAEAPGAAPGMRYTAGTLDGRPAWFTIDPSRPEARLTHRLEPLVLQWTVPGLHVQTGLARELDSLPAFRRAFDVPAFARGWALYAQSLGTELGTVYRDPAERFGQFAQERAHAIALVVDTGIHALGWSRAQAEAYVSRQAPLDDAAGAVDRYAASPADAVADKLGEIGIREQRRRVERELGPWFDAREFHEIVLGQGAVPLDVLEERVTAYIAAARASVQ